MNIVQEIVASKPAPAPMRAQRRSADRQVVLVLQGGGALGAYQAGVYQALHEAHIEPDNAASLRLAERLGFRREGLMRDQLFVEGKPRDALLYALLRPEWPPA